jgi:hypothetical protein
MLLKHLTTHTNSGTAEQFIGLPTSRNYLTTSQGHSYQHRWSLVPRRSTARQGLSIQLFQYTYSITLIFRSQSLEI